MPRGRPKKRARKMTGLMNQCAEGPDDERIDAAAETSDVSATESENELPHRSRAPSPPEQTPGKSPIESEDPDYGWNPGVHLDSLRILVHEEEDLDSDDEDAEEEEWEGLDDEEFFTHLYEMLLQYEDNLKDEDWLPRDIKREINRRYTRKDQNRMYCIHTWYS